MELGRKNPEAPEKLETEKSFENEATRNPEQDKKRADSLDENKGIEKISEQKDSEKNKKQAFNQTPEEKRAEKIEQKSDLHIESNKGQENLKQEKQKETHESTQQENYTSKMKLEDMNWVDVHQMQEQNQEKLDSINKEYQERISAEGFGMSVEEYRAHLDRIEKANEPEDVPENPNLKDWRSEMVNELLQNSSSSELKIEQTDIESHKDDENKKTEYSIGDSPNNNGNETYWQKIETATETVEKIDAGSSKQVTVNRAEKESVEVESNAYISQNLEKERLEMSDKVRDINSSYYEQAGELAKNNLDGRTFTDHRQEHVEMVSDKSLEGAYAIKEAVDRGGLGQNSKEGRVRLSSDIDEKTLEGAALSHDTGMRGEGYALTPALDESGKQCKDERGKKLYEKDESGNYVIHPVDNNSFNEIRENHSLNSAITVLENRNQYKDAGYTDEQIDKMAAECMAHSKSSSGVSDLNSKDDWTDCFDRMDAAIEAYNKDHSNSPISFNRTLFESDNNKLGSLASETFALRVGDVSRNSHADAKAQSGEGVHVDRTTIDDRAGSIEGELKNAKITIGENGNSVDKPKSRQVHVGEQNISDNHTFVNEEGILTHEITVADGTSAPKCTQEALKDHLGELASAKDESFDVNIIFDKTCDEFVKESYEDFRINAKKRYPNVTISYPWDNEEA